MSRGASSFIVAVLVLAAASGAGTASAGKAVTPELGLYYSQTVKDPGGGSVLVRQTEVKVVRVGKNRGAAVRASAIPATCDGGLKGQPWGFNVLEKSPIVIRKGKFRLDRTTRETVAGGSGNATTRTTILGTFKSPTKVVVSVSVSSDITVQYPGQPEIKGTCTGKQTATATHR